MNIIHPKTPQLRHSTTNPVVFAHHPPDSYPLRDPRVGTPIFPGKVNKNPIVGVTEGHTCIYSRRAQSFDIDGWISRCLELLQYFVKLPGSPLHGYIIDNTCKFEYCHDIIINKLMFATKHNIWNGKEQNVSLLKTMSLNNWTYDLSNATVTVPNTENCLTYSNIPTV